MKPIIAILLCASAAQAASTNLVGRIVLINDAGATRPANSIATPAQVEAATGSADAARTAAQQAQSTADFAKAVAQAASNRIYLFSSNYVVTSTVYVQSIGGVPYDPSNQVMTVRSVTLSDTSVVVLATCSQVPLTPPALDWRQSLKGGAWSNVAATVAAAQIPGGITNAAAAYTFTVPRPAASTAFFRVKDNSTGASGSGLYWLVFGGIYVDGHRGRYGAITNAVGSTTNVYLLKGGIVVEPNPI
jgi:hypothetical protein